MKSAVLKYLIVTLLASGSAVAADLPDSSSGPVPKTPPAAPAPPALLPAMAGPLTANPDPFFVPTPFGKIYVTGVLSGMLQSTTNPIANPFDPARSSQGDLTNAQIFIQKVDGPIQFFADFGAYSLPALGTPYFTSLRATHDYFSYVPMAFLKIAPTDTFSFEVGALPTLVGAEYNFTFQNMNIDRGLLWNQESAVSKGIQVNYTVGPLALSASLNDGFDSNHYSWLSGSATYTINPQNSLAFIAAGNLQRTLANSIVTPILQNNSQIYNLIYTYTNAPWTLTAYAQYSVVPALPAYTNAYAATAATTSGSTEGVGLLANYSFPEKSFLAGLSLPVRLEYIASTGNSLTGPNLINGPGSKAWSATFTPTYQYKRFFVRGEASYVKLQNGTLGSEFGPLGNKTSQARFKLETGVIF
ncbi:MAG: outer membrane beta-barrel protein [Hyphomicrobiales bacterium]|nr:outer membrane beta-barrel protein [Hyphomicrobiales bacterium]